MLRGSEMLPAGPWDQPPGVSSFSLGYEKDELQKSRSYSLCCFQCVFGCMGALRFLNISYL